MSEKSNTILTRAIEVADPDLRDQLADLLNGLEGIELVVGDASPDLVVSQPDRTVSPDLLPDFSPREEEVLAILAEGASNPEIARRLGISLGTVKFHVRAILDKLDATGRTDAVAHAARLGVIQL